MPRGKPSVRSSSSQAPVGAHGVSLRGGMWTGDAGRQLQREDEERQSLAAPARIAGEVPHSPRSFGRQATARRTQRPLEGHGCHLGPWRLVEGTRYGPPTGPLPSQMSTSAPCVRRRVPRELPPFAAHARNKIQSLAGVKSPLNCIVLCFDRKGTLATLFKPCAADRVGRGGEGRQRYWK